LLTTFETACFSKPGSAPALPLISVHSRLTRLCAAQQACCLKTAGAVFKLIDYITVRRTKACRGAAIGKRQTKIARAGIVSRAGDFYCLYVIATQLIAQQL